MQGRSAGGLTMGASLNLRPDLYKAAILGVPFVDVLTTMLDDTIPLTTTEVKYQAKVQHPYMWECLKACCCTTERSAGVVIRQIFEERQR